MSAREREVLAGALEKKGECLTFYPPRLSSVKWVRIGMVSPIFLTKMATHLKSRALIFGLPHKM